MKNYLYLILLTGFVFSCTKELPFPDFNINPVLVVNSAFTPDEDFLVEVTTSISNESINSQPTRIKDATVTIVEESTGTKTELPHSEDGFYTLEGFNPIAGKTYGIEVAAPKFTTVKSSITDNIVPGTFSFSLKDYHMGVYKNTNTFYATIEIEDNPQEVNYYIISIHDQIEVYELSEVNNVYGHFSNDSNTEIIDNSDEFNSGQRNLYLPDSNFSAQKYTLEFWWSHPILQGLEQTSGNYLECHVTSVSKLYYDYQRSLELHKNAGDNDFASPVSVASNIENGLGIFAGYYYGGFIRIDL